VELMEETVAADRRKREKAKAEKPFQPEELPPASENGPTEEIPSVG
jgi:hypothetical protein